LKTPVLRAAESSGVPHFKIVKGVLGLLFLSVTSSDGGFRESCESLNSRPGTLFDALELHFDIVYEIDVGD
jgi:hypothetical protein